MYKTKLSSHVSFVSIFNTRISSYCFRSFTIGEIYTQLFLYNLEEGNLVFGR